MMQLGAKFHVKQLKRGGSRKRSSTWNRESPMMQLGAKFHVKHTQRRGCLPAYLATTMARVRAGPAAAGSEYG